MLMKDNNYSNVKHGTIIISHFQLDWNSCKVTLNWKIAKLYIVREKKFALQLR